MPGKSAECNEFMWLAFYMLYCRTWTRRCLGHERGGSYPDTLVWGYEWGGSYPDTLVWGHERGGSYVPYSHLTDAASGEVRSWWITCVGLRTGRSV
ncbi:hypothetical protein DEO72_LG3g1446 [Vigna unguiculata]|uniref:Uncharacterized protein n=1 Tax=Vigna unguiculata TaxID=3917 RepID=A0A4D6LEB1_VIGUN|nr:hypothetical protein DEO72_LG3g1446 [Vigna unguiculata]